MTTSFAGSFCSHKVGLRGHWPKWSRKGEEWKLFGEALTYHTLGRCNDADGALRKLIATRQQDRAFQIAEVYAFRGESDKAWEWLNRACRQRDSGLMFLKIDPLLEKPAPRPQQ
jgi:predicted Zn-dependent protease